jgi:hypothetical protein
MAEYYNLPFLRPLGQAKTLRIHRFRGYAILYGHVSGPHSPLVAAAKVGLQTSNHLVISVRGPNLIAAEIFHTVL